MKTCNNCKNGPMPCDEYSNAETCTNYQACTFKEFLAKHRNDPVILAEVRRAELQFEQAMDAMVDESYEAHFPHD